MSTSMASTADFARAMRIVDDAWEELRGTFEVQSQLGMALARLPDVSPEEAQRRSLVGQSLLARLTDIDIDALPHELALTLRVVRFRSEVWARESQWYWTVVDPLGVGFFGMFLPTVYCGGYLLNSVNARLAAFRFAGAGDCDRYLALVSDYARLIDQFNARTTGQRERGMLMPRAQIGPARALLTALKADIRTALSVASERLKGIPAHDFTRELDRRIQGSVEPAFDRALAIFSEDYESRAPVGVGLGQYAEGQEIYSELIKLHTTLTLSAEQVHAQGFKRMAEIEAAMQAIRTELQFTGDGKAFVKHLNEDPRWRASSVDGVKAVFQRYIDRLALRFRDYFATAPQAAYGIAPLPAALQGSMTFGYYDPPGPGRNQGVFYFNSGNLTQQALFNVGALTYHELVPGHHLHLCTQLDNSTLHPFRTHSNVNAYNEGWAEYAATFAGEIGMYEEPEERYGRLVMDAFLTCRLVVDTGMNALGWSLERAREYMREHSGMAETEVLSETLRYSCDIPGQSLAYKLGDTQILGMRERMRDGLGSSFDLKTFHAAILGPGALPITDLQWHVDWEIARLRAG